MDGLPEWAKEVRLEDLKNQTAREMAEIIGVENTMKLIIVYSSSTFYMPKMDSIYRVVRDRRINAEYNGRNVRELAIKYDVSENWVRRIVEPRGIKGEQIGMFDESAIAI